MFRSGLREGLRRKKRRKKPWGIWRETRHLSRRTAFGEFKEDEVSTGRERLVRDEVEGGTQQTEQV